MEILSFFMKGYRFSSDAAVHTIQFAQTNTPEIVLDQQISSDLVFYLIDTGDYYHTVYCRRSAFLWRSVVDAHSCEKTEDDAALLSKFWLKDPGVGWIVSISHDPEVNSFLITCGSQTVQQQAILNQPTVIVIQSPNITGMDVGFHAAALAKDERVLYHLDYLMENGTVYSSAYRWFPEDANSEQR